MLLTRGDDMVTASEAARAVGVTPRTIHNWRRAGLLAARGMNERGWAMFRLREVREAEREARRLGMQRLNGGTDPRRLRKPKPRGSYTPEDEERAPAAFEAVRRPLFSRLRRAS